MVPAQLVVLVIAVLIGEWFDLSEEHTYLFPNSFFDSDDTSAFEVGPRFLVAMPEVLKDPSTSPSPTLAWLRVSVSFTW